MTFLFQKKNIFLLLFFFPLTHIVGIALTEFYIFCFTIFLCLNFRNKELKLSRLILFISIFSIYVGINAFIQIPDNLKLSSIFHFRYVLFAISIYIFLEVYKRPEKNLRYVFLLIILFISILLVDSCIQYFTGQNIIGQKLSRYGYRVSSFFGDDLILGSFLMRLLPIILWYSYYVNLEINSKKITSIIFFSVYFFTIYISGERTAFGLTILMILMITLFINELREIFIKSFLIFVILVAIVTFFNLGKENTFHRMFVKTYNQFVDKNADNNLSSENVFKKKELSLIEKIENITIFSSDHHGHLVIAKDLFIKNPIFGVGPKGFRYYCRTVEYDPPKGVCSTHPHNILAQLLAELGFFGFLFYFIFIIYIFQLIFSHDKNKINYFDNKLIIILIGLFINLFPFLPSGNFFNNWISSFLYFKIGLMLFSLKKI
ncbi:O-antigen ligase family protein [Candidatus Pelagibacter sp. HIMB1321]|uniref:O-antigen ligase family protein n=1 Tax=Candidatus Pelagibacter sp. HIMB1321 TaxID=1388755 RepID=UPI000A07E5E5|nr:O-antigen ligase family protein [Candidatus Pelagibacter sp. HIMB1321]SMF79448.1 O-antigen ligase like membrane protein [Candidatus Pelagibacter sp. HIMB1321]